MDDRRGSAWFGLPAMLAAITFVVFAKASNVLVGAIACILLLLIIGAVVSMAKRRPKP